MNNDKIYPTMVIRSQEEVIKLLEEENKKLYKRIKELEDGFKASNEELSMVYNELEQKNKIIEEIKEDIDFVRKSVCQELYMSKDERTRIEMDSCYHILTEALEKGSEE